MRCEAVVSGLALVRMAFLPFSGGARPWPRREFRFRQGRRGAARGAYSSVRDPRRLRCL